MQYLHTMVRVTDLDEALEFYCTKLGLTEVRRKEDEQGRYTLVFLAAPDDMQLAQERNAPLVELTYNWDSEEYSGGRNFAIQKLPGRIHPTLSGRPESSRMGAQFCRAQQYRQSE